MINDTINQMVEEGNYALYEVYELKSYLDNLPRKDGVHLIEGISDKERKVIKEITKSIIGACKISLSRDIPFVAGFASDVKLVISFSLEAPMAVNCITRGLKSSPILYVNPVWLIYKGGNYIEKDYFVNDKNFEDVTAILLHEMFHLLYNHIPTYEYYSKRGFHQVANIATDCQINQHQRIAKNKTLTEYGITLDGVRKIINKPDLEKERESFYYFSEILKANKNNNNPDQSSLTGDQSGNSGSGGNSSSNPNENGEPNLPSDSDSQSGNNNSQKDIIDDMCDDSINNSHKAWYEVPEDAEEELGADCEIAQGEDAEQAVADTIKNVIQRDDYSESDLRGIVAGNLLGRVLEGTATKGKLPIKSLIQKGAGRFRAGIKKTYAKINKQQSNKIVIKKGKKKMYNKNIRIFCDNSGSMGVEEIEFALNEAAAVAKQLKANLTIIPFDTQLYLDSAAVVNKNGRYQYIQTGMGGTSFQPVFDYLDQINVNDTTDLAIILTDGYGESSVETYGFSNIIWILVDQKTNTLSVRNPKGQIGYLVDDNKYKLFKASKA